MVCVSPLCTRLLSVHRHIVERLHPHDHDSDMIFDMRLALDQYLLWCLHMSDTAFGLSRYPASSIWWLWDGISLNMRTIRFLLVGRKVIPIVRRCTSYCVGALNMCQQTGNAGKLYSPKSGIQGGSCEVYSCGQLLGRTWQSFTLQTAKMLLIVADHCLEGLKMTSLARSGFWICILAACSAAENRYDFLPLSL